MAKFELSVLTESWIQSRLDHSTVSLRGTEVKDCGLTKDVDDETTIAFIAVKSVL